MARGRRQDILIGSAFVLLNLVLKGIAISTNSIGGDEPFSIYHAQLPVADLLHLIGQTNNPPLYELLLHYWILFFGDDPWVVRLPSLVFAALTAYFVYRVGNDEFNRKTGICAALIFTFSLYSTEYAHEARVYALFGLLATMSMFFYLRFIRGNKSALGFMIVVNALMLYAHYFAPFVVFVQSLHLVLYRDLRSTKLKSYALYLVVLLLAYLPNLITFVSRFTHSASSGTWVPAPDGIDHLYTMLWNLCNMPVTTVACIILTLGGCVLCLRLNEHKAFSLLILWFVVPFFTIYFVSFAIPMMIPRYLMFLSTALLLLVSAVCFLLPVDRKLQYGIAATLLALFVFTWKPDVFNKRPSAEVVAHTLKIRKENEQVIIHPKMYVLDFAYHYDRELFRTPFSSDVHHKMDSLFEARNIHFVEYASELPTLDSALIFVNTNGFEQYYKSEIRRTIATQLQLTDSLDFPNIYSVYNTPR